MDAMRLYIGGEWRAAAGGRAFPVENPADQSIVAEVAAASPADVDAAVVAARRALRESDWRRNPRRRAQALREMAARVREKAGEIARVLTQENGKSIREARAELMGAIDGFEFYAGLARVLYGRAAEFLPDVYGVVLHEPMGVVAIIVPWNWPLTLLVRSLAPALAAGNAVVVKPASWAPISTLRLVEAIASVAALPPGVVNVVTGSGEVVGNALVEHPDVAMVAFTGDSTTGKEVMRRAAGTMKKVSLELGGKSANIVFADADLDKAVPGAVNAAFTSAGEICTAGSRLLVEETIAERFLDRLTEQLARLKVGDGLEEDTNMGPLISGAHLERVWRYVEEGRRSARLVFGGERLGERGYFLAPTVFADVDPGSPLAQEEIFGPVLSVLTFRDEDEAVAIANRSRYGLAAGLWSRDLDRVLRVASALETGTVWVNTYHQFYNEAEVGGYKESGVGRHQGVHVLEEFSQLKHVNLDTRRQWVASR